MLAALGVVAVAVASGGSALRVKNSEFDISAELPAGAVMCREAHGFSFLMKPRPERCKSAVAQPYMAFFGDYNVIGYTTPRQSLSTLCAKEGDKIGEAVSGLSFPRHLSASCEQRKADGWINIFVQALGGKWPDEKSQSGKAYIIYTAQLHTQRGRLKQDIEKFRRALETVELSPR
jgi:hypothetical protein